MHKWICSKEQINEIIRLWNEDGLYIKEIAKHFGTSERTIRRYSTEFRRTGVMVDRVQKQLDKITHLWNVEKLSVKAISNHFGVSEHSIRRDIKKITESGVVLVDNEQARLDEVNRLWNKEGLSAVAIAKIFNVNESTIHRYSKKLQKSGVIMADRRGRIKKDVISTIRSLKRGGLAMGNIAKQLDISKNTVWKYANNVDVKPQKQIEVVAEKPITNKKLEDIISRSASGLNIYQANMCHLIDLKRAGYSPTKTELRIPAGVPDFLPIQHGRVGSSPAGLWTQI